MMMPAEVTTLYDAYPKEIADRLLEIRELIINAADHTDGVGTVLECLKWGQHSFVTINPKSGSTIRIDALKNEPGKIAVFFICTTGLVEAFRERYPTIFDFRGNRSLVFDIDDALPKEELSHCIAMALTYHIRQVG